MLEAIDTPIVTCQQKLRLYKKGVWPRLCWPLLVDDFTITWLEHGLQPIATKYLKRWAGLQQWSCAATAGDMMRLSQSWGTLFRPIFHLHSPSISTSLLPPTAIRNTSLQQIYGRTLSGGVMSVENCGSLS